MRPKLVKHYFLVKNYQDKSHRYGYSVEKDLILDMLKKNPDMELRFEIDPLYKRGRIQEFEDIHLFDKYVPDEKIDDFLKSFPLYVSFGESNDLIRYFYCRLRNNFLIIDDEFEELSALIPVEFSSKYSSFKVFVYDFVENLKVQDLVSGSSLI